MRRRWIGKVENGVARNAFALGEPVASAAVEAEDGSWVRCEGTPDGVDAALLAAPASALAELYRIAAERSLSPLHSPSAMAEAAALVAAPGIDDPTLFDLTGLPFVTLDEASSRDLDQAVFVERLGSGYRVWYAIADASWGVRPGSALFAEALARGATFYLPGLVLPMLPLALSEGVISLNQGVDRRAMVFEIELDPAGEVLVVRLHRARVRSRLKSSFDAVQVFLDGVARLPGGTAEIERSLRALAEVGERRVARAEARHVVQLRRRELAVSLSDGPERRFVAFDDTRLPIERANEQISLLANVEGARLLAAAVEQRGVQPIFRYHEPPQDERLGDLARRIFGIVEVHGLDVRRWSWTPHSEPLADYLRRLPDRGDEGRIARAIHRQALLSGGRSGFAAEPLGHHGVGAEVYARFTAPMREIVGIFVHKEAWEALSGAGGEEAAIAADEELRSAVLQAAQRAKQRQRELDQEANRLVLDQLFAVDLAAATPPWRPATILGITPSKLHVQLDAQPIDVKVYVRHLSRQRGERLRPARHGAALLGRGGATVFAVGDAVELAVAGRDRQRDRWELALRRVAAQP